MIRAALLTAFLAIAPAQAGQSTKCLPPQIKRVLSDLKRFGRVEIISTYRKGAIIAGTHKRSKHASCRAVDFHLHGNRKAAMRWLLAQPIEIITYGGAMHHIHIATGSYRGHHVVNSRGARR